MFCNFDLYLSLQYRVNNSDVFLLGWRGEGRKAAAAGGQDEANGGHEK
jgi:hypothetical protein